MVRSRLEQLIESYEGTKDNIGEETMSKMTYQHILDRMKKDHISTKIKSAELDTSLRSKSQILELEN
jgi:hypothetical protein